MFLSGVANLIWDGYGEDFLDVMASVYPGYDATASFGQVIVGTLYWSTAALEVSLRGTWRKVALTLAWIVFLAAVILFFCASPVSSRAV